MVAGASLGLATTTIVWRLRALDIEHDVRETVAYYYNHSKNQLMIVKTPHLALF